MYFALVNAESNQFGSELLKQNVSQLAGESCSEFGKQFEALEVFKNYINTCR
jgi:hypothetical protein